MQSRFWSVLLDVAVSIQVFPALFAILVSVGNVTPSVYVW